MEASSSYPTGSAPPLQSTPYVYHPQVPAQAGQHLASANEGSAPLVTVSYPVTNQTPSVPAVGQASETTGSGQDTSAPLVTITAWSQPGSATTSQQPVAHPPAGNVQQATVMPSDHHEAVASTLPHSGSATVASSQGVQVQPSPDPSPVPSVAGQGAQMGFQQAAVASSAPPGVGGQGMSTQGKDEQAFAPSAPPMVPQQAQAPMYAQQAAAPMQPMVAGPPTPAGQVVQGQPSAVEGYPKQPYGQPQYSPQQLPYQQQPQYQQQPPYQQATYQQPTYQQPTYQQPTYQQPPYQQPSYQQPSYQQPPYQQPVYQQPPYQQSGYTAAPPPQQAVYAQPVQHAYAQPVYAQPVYAQPIQQQQQQPYGGVPSAVSYSGPPVYAQPVYGQQPQQQQQYQAYPSGPAGSQYTHNIYRP